MTLRPVVKYHLIVWPITTQHCDPQEFRLKHSTETTGRLCCSREQVRCEEQHVPLVKHTLVWWRHITQRARGGEREAGEELRSTEEELRSTGEEHFTASCCFTPPLSTDSTVRHGAPPVQPEQLRRRAEPGSGWSCAAGSLLRWVPSDVTVKNNGLVQFILCQHDGHTTVEHWAL